MIYNHDVQWNSLKKLQPWKMFSFCYWKSGGTFKTLCACFDKLFWGEQLCGDKSGRFNFWWEIKIFIRATSIFVSRNKWLNGCFRMLPQLRLLAAPIKEIKQKEENVTKYQLSTSQNQKMSTQYSVTLKFIFTILTQICTSWCSFSLKRHSLPVETLSQLIWIRWQ